MRVESRFDIVRRLGDSRVAMAASALVAGQLVRMLSGLIFWGIATRTFPAANVGIAAAAVAAMMICSQLALLGAGSSVIRLYPQAGRLAGELVAAAFKVVLIAATVIGGGFLVLSASALTELSQIGRDPIFATAFITACVLGACHGLANEVSVARGRPSEIVVRAVALSTVMLLVISGWVGLGLPKRSDVIFGCWAVGELAACAFLVRQLEPWGSAKTGWMIAAANMRAVAARGIANHSLTLADRTPPMLMTIVIAEVLSAELGAYWYAVWMAALTVFLVPIYSGTALFSDLVREGEVQARKVWGNAVRTLAVAAALAITMAVLAGEVLDFLGSAYAAYGERPAQILAAAVVPVTILQTYFAVCRASDRLREAAVTAALAGVAAVIVGAWLGSEYSLEGVAGAWLGAQSAAAAWAFWRLTRLTEGRSRIHRDTVRQPLVPEPRGGRETRKSEADT